MGSWEISRVSTKVGLREAWSIWACYEPSLWVRMDGYDDRLTKMAGPATTLIIEIEGETAGDISFYSKGYINSDTKRGYITQVMTAPGFRGCGVGTRLLAE